MLLKLGVDISRLSRPCRISLKIVEAEFNKLKEEAVITSTYEGDHGVSSLHYNDNAYDVRQPQKMPGAVMRDNIKKILGSNFDIVFHRRHIHIEFDPK